MRGRGRRAAVVLAALGALGALGACGESASPPRTGEPTTTPVADEPAPSAEGTPSSPAPPATAGTSGPKAPAPAAPAAPAAPVSPLPAVGVRDLASGADRDLAGLLPTDRPLLIWFWAPH